MPRGNGGENDRCGRQYRSQATEPLKPVPQHRGRRLVIRVMPEILRVRAPESNGGQKARPATEEDRDRPSMTCRWLATPGHGVPSRVQR